MRWRRTIFVALLTAIAGAVATFVVGEIVIREAELNNYAGLRTERLVFLIVPAAALGASVIGLFVALVSSSRGLAAMMTTSVCIAFAAIVAGGAISYVLADKPPRSGGKPLVLEFEVRVPESVALPVPIDDKGFYPSIFETPDAHWYTHINFRNVVRSGSDIIIGGYARLRSSRATERSIADRLRRNCTTLAKSLSPIARPSRGAG